MRRGYDDEDEQHDGEEWTPARCLRRGRSARPEPRFRQVVEQATQVGSGLGVHGPADLLVELGLVQAAVAEVLGQAVGDRLPLGAGNRRC